MKILLVGDYSNVHATLAEGLRTLGHDLTVASDGDGWKNFPRDVDLSRKGRNGLVHYLRLWSKFHEFRGYDVVQIINPVFLPLKAERIWPFYRFLRRHNNKIVMGAFGMDYYYIDACLDCKTFRYSDFNFGSQLRHYPTADAFRCDWYEGRKGELNRRIASDCDGIVSGLYEYWASYQRISALREKLTYIPFPIKVSNAAPSSSSSEDRLGDVCTFFVGIQRGKEEYKGTDVMLRAAEAVRDKYPDRMELLKAESVPFAQYQQMIEGSDAILDQLYAYTPSMNPLLAMSKGIICIGGGEPENYDIIHESELRPIINVEPTYQSVYDELEQLVLHPERIPELKRQSVAYVRRHHDYLKVARQYLDFWLAR